MIDGHYVPYASRKEKCPEKCFSHQSNLFFRTRQSSVPQITSASEI